MLRFLGSICLALFCLTLIWANAAQAENLVEHEHQVLLRYLAELQAGVPANAAKVDQLAEIPFSGLVEVMKSYADLPESAEEHTHRAYQGLLERTSRTALAPWPLVTLYSPEFANFLSEDPAQEGLSRKLFAQIIKGPVSYQACELAVRLAPVASLEYLASDQQRWRVDLLGAWNRRLGDRDERRPLPQLTERLQAIAERMEKVEPATELTRDSQLRFLSRWPQLRASYERVMTTCLESDQQELVAVGLHVQQQPLFLIERNEALIERWQGVPKIVERILRNYAYDQQKDHSATLRRHWSQLPATATKARYNCLFAMGVHPQGNEAIALEAVEANAYEYIDVAMPILAAGEREFATRAVRHVLTKSKRGHEEALRLARSLKLSSFEDEALALAGDPAEDQILRQTALLYLQIAPGGARRKLLPLLDDWNEDIRLTAIQMFAEPEGLSAEDKDAIGPALIHLALDDSSPDGPKKEKDSSLKSVFTKARNPPSPGHRQEAIFALGRWEDSLAEPFFRRVLKDNPPVTILDGHYNDERYWQYRFRLVALLSLARLNDEAALRELLTLHASGGPTEKMDVLLALLELGIVPDAALADLEADEPKLIATAARLIHDHGSPAQKEQMRDRFRAAPLWLEFRRSGADDHRILSAVGLEEVE